MIARDTRKFMAVLAIAQHFGRPSTPTDQAWIESLNGTIKGEWPHLLAITDPAVLRAELELVRTEYNTVRLHSGVGYVTPQDEHTGGGEAIRSARRRGLHHQPVVDVGVGPAGVGALQRCVQQALSLQGGGEREPHLGVSLLNRDQVGLPLAADQALDDQDGHAAPGEVGRVVDRVGPAGRLVGERATGPLGWTRQGQKVLVLQRQHPPYRGRGRAEPAEVGTPVG